MLQSTDKFLKAICQMGDLIVIFLIHMDSVSYTHLDVYKRQEIGASGLGAFFVIQVLLEHFIAHTYSSLFLMASSICLLTVSI